MLYTISGALLYGGENFCIYVSMYLCIDVSMWYLWILLFCCSSNISIHSHSFTITIPHTYAYTYAYTHNYIIMDAPHTQHQPWSHFGSTAAAGSKTTIWWMFRCVTLSLCQGLILGVVLRILRVILYFSLYWWSRIRPAQIQAQVRGWMFKGYSVFFSILVVWSGAGSVSCIMWSGALKLDLQLWSSSIILYNITIITHNLPAY